MKNLTLSLFLLLLSFNSFAQNILVVGDSHTAGPFGSYLHKNLKQQCDSVVTLGHASSAPYHWMSSKVFSLGGGVFNQLYSEGITATNPNPTHWRVKVSVPKFETVLDDVRYHSAWKKKVDPILLDAVVIALGANDSRVIATQNGTINSYQYKVRQRAILDMIDLVKENNLKCIWVGPPNGLKKTQANQKVTYQYLKEAVTDYCDFFDSNHYKATGCDGVHFSCGSQMHKAKAWAKEVSDFVQEKL